MNLCQERPRTHPAVEHLADLLQRGDLPNDAVGAAEKIVTALNKLLDLIVKASTAATASADDSCPVESYLDALYVPGRPDIGRAYLQGDYGPLEAYLKEWAALRDTETQ